MCDDLKRGQLNKAVVQLGAQNWLGNIVVIHIAVGTYDLNRHYVTTLHHILAKYLLLKNIPLS